MTIIDTTTPSRSRTDDEDLIALIAAHEKLHEDGLPAGLGKADRKRASAIFDQIKATIPVTIEGVLAMLEYSDYEDDPLIVAAVAGFRAIVERCALEQPPLLAPGASDVQKLIAVEWRIRSMGIKISDALTTSDTGSNVSKSRTRACTSSAPAWMIWSPRPAISIPGSVSRRACFSIGSTRPLPSRPLSTRSLYSSSMNRR